MIKINNNDVTRCVSTASLQRCFEEKNIYIDHCRRTCLRPVPFVSFSLFEFPIGEAPFQYYFPANEFVFYSFHVRDYNNTFLPSGLSDRIVLAFARNTNGRNNDNNNTTTELRV